MPHLRGNFATAVGAGVALTLLLGACNNDGKNGNDGTTTTRAAGPTTTTVKKPDPTTPLGMFCGSFEKYLQEAAKPAPKNVDELKQAVQNGRAVLAEVVERALPEIAADAKKLRDATFTYWDALAKAGHNVAKVSNETKTAYLQDTAAARTNLERFGTGTCGIVTTTTAPRQP